MLNNYNNLSQTSIILEQMLIMVIGARAVRCLQIQFCSKGPLTGQPLLTLLCVSSTSLKNTCE